MAKRLQVRELTTYGFEIHLAEAMGERTIEYGNSCSTILLIPGLRIYIPVYIPDGNHGKERNTCEAGSGIQNVTYLCHVAGVFLMVAYSQFLCDTSIC